MDSCGAGATPEEIHEFDDDIPSRGMTNSYTQIVYHNSVHSQFVTTPFSGAADAQLPTHVSCCFNLGVVCSGLVHQRPTRKPMACAKQCVRIELSSTCVVAALEVHSQPRPFLSRLHESCEIGRLIWTLPVATHWRPRPTRNTRHPLGLCALLAQEPC